MADPQDDEKYEEWMKEVYGKEYAWPPKPFDIKDRDNNTMKKILASDDDSEDENKRDPNDIPTGFTSREVKVWESKAKSIEINWKQKKEEELTCCICGEKAILPRYVSDSGNVSDFPCLLFSFLETLDT